MRCISVCWGLPRLPLPRPRLNFILTAPSPEEGERLKKPLHSDLLSRLKRHEDGQSPVVPPFVIETSVLVLLMVKCAALCRPHPDPGISLLLRDTPGHLPK